MLGLLLRRHFQNLFEIVERCFRLAIRVDDIAQFLQRAKNEKRIDEKREKLPYGNALGVNQVEHQKKDRSPQEIDEAALNETQAAEVADLFELQLEDFVRGRIKAINLWSSKTQLFTNSMFRKDSVVAPARAVVSVTIRFWTVLTLRLNRELRLPSSGTVNK